MPMVDTDGSYAVREDLHAHLRDYGVDSWYAYREACTRLALPQPVPNTPVMRAQVIEVLHALKKEQDNAR